MTKHPSNRAQRLAARKHSLGNEEKKQRAQERAGHLRVKLAKERTKEEEAEDELRTAYDQAVDGQLLRSYRNTASSFQGNS